MAINVILPKEGGIETAVITAWLKKKGDATALGDIICTVESNKAVTDILSPADGVVLDIFYNEGDEVPVLAVVAVVGKFGEKFNRPEPIKKMAVPDFARKDALVLKQEVPLHFKKKDENIITPKAKKLLFELKLNAASIPGSGYLNSVTYADVLQAAKNSREKVYTLFARVNGGRVLYFVNLLKDKGVVLKQFILFAAARALKNYYKLGRLPLLKLDGYSGVDESGFRVLDLSGYGIVSIVPIFRGSTVLGVGKADGESLDVTLTASGDEEYGAAFLQTLCGYIETFDLLLVADNVQKEN